MYYVRRKGKKKMRVKLGNYKLYKITVTNI